MSSLAEAPIDQRPLVLLDGMSLAFRAFFALPTDIATSEGLVTNALHGFAAMLLSLVRTQNPRALAVAFDLPGGTFRDAMVEDYKGGRAETPPEIEHQFDLIRNLCEVLHIPVLGRAELRGRRRAGDPRHLGAQRVDPGGGRDRRPRRLPVGRGPLRQGALQPARRLGLLALRRGGHLRALPASKSTRYPLLAALRGDTSDNLPGVPGVGEKTAAKLFAQYRDMDDLYAHLGDLTPKLRENLATYEERARNNEKVMLPHSRRAAGLHAARHHAGRLEPRGDRRLLRPLRDEPDAHPLRAAHEGGSPGRGRRGERAAERSDAGEEDQDRQGVEGAPTSLDEVLAVDDVAGRGVSPRARRGAGRREGTRRAL